MTAAPVSRAVRPVRTAPQLTRRTRTDLVADLRALVPAPADGPEERVARHGTGTVAFLRPRAVTDPIGCLACARADDETRRWFFFFETETNADDAVRARIRAAGGLCPPHTRRLLGSTAAAAWLARGVFDDLLRQLAHPPHRRRGPSAGAAPTAAPCPVCVAVSARVRDTLRVLDAGLSTDHGAGGGAEVAETYLASPGLCVGHLRQLAALATPRATGLAAAHLADALTRSPEAVVSALTGNDDDRPGRARQRARHGPAVLAAAAAARRESFDARVAHLLAQPCCPRCAARDRGVWRLLEWLAGRPGSGDPARAAPDAAAMREQLAAVCPTHLGDLVADDGGGAWLSAPVATVARVSAARWRESLDTLVRAAPRLSAPALRRLAGAAGPRMSCPVCTWSAAAADAETRLLRLLADDPRRTSALDRAHPPCARCLPVVGAAAGTAMPGPWERLFAARARELSFELSEAVRADAWSARWDVSGSERSAWLRAPTLLDGAILGPRAPVSA